MILDRLRAATGPAHERLEEHVDLLGRPWSRSFYLSLLQRFYGFYSAVEPQVLGCPGWSRLGFDTHARRKLPLLRRDLESLGLSARGIDALPVCSYAPSPTGLAGALGCAYVLEGSTLGGQVITRHLRRELGTTAEQSTAFFSSYGPEVGRMWREFIHLLNSQALSPAEEDALLQSACATFSSLDEWLAPIL